MSGQVLCQLCFLESIWARNDWEREEKIDRKQFFQRPVIAVDHDDDWRASAYAKAIRSPVVRWPCSDKTVWLRLRPLRYQAKSYSPPLGDNYEDLLPIEYRLAHVELKVAIYEALKLLTPREEVVLRKRFGLIGVVETNGISIEIDCDEMTLSDIARDLNLSHERVRQIEGTALRKLSRRRFAKQLEPFL